MGNGGGGSVGNGGLIESPTSMITLPFACTSKSPEEIRKYLQKTTCLPLKNVNLHQKGAIQPAELECGDNYSPTLCDCTSDLKAQEKSRESHAHQT